MTRSGLWTGKGWKAMSGVRWWFVFPVGTNAYRIHTSDIQVEYIG